MPAKIGDNKAVPFFLFGTDDEGVKGAPLADGQTVDVVSADPLTVLVVKDPTPLPAPDGTLTIWSGKVSAPNPPANPNQPITLTSKVLNADGTPGTADDGTPIVPETDTVTIQPGLTKAIGDLFGTPV